jgi:G6PDH family F420-dependent oxidoreductase
VLGDRWPPADQRLEMLEEAVELIRVLHHGVEVTHHGRHYLVENARIYTVPAEPVRIYVSGFGPKAARLAGRIGDGYVSTKPDSSLVRAFREGGGGDKPAQGGLKCCHSRTEGDGLKTAHRLWANTGLPGELAQVLPTPKHFEQASTLVKPEMMAGSVPTGPAPDAYVAAIQSFVDAGYDEIYVNQIGPEQDAFFRFWNNELRPAVSGLVGAGR